MPRDQEAKPPRPRGAIKLAETARCVLLLALALGFASLPGDARAQAFTPDIADPGIADPGIADPGTADPGVINPGVIAGPPGSGNAGIVPGSAAISGFSGATLSAAGLRPGVDPLNKTVIDTAGASLRVFDLSAIGARPAGHRLNPATIFEVKAGEIGQVFPLALDDGDGSGTANLYAGATSAFGIQIVAAQPDSDGTPIRLKTGAPGARFMDGQFGSLAGASPGVIWKIDGMTGEPSIFADTGQNGPGNSGPGIGGLAFDPATRSLYASDLDNGLILRFPIDGGRRPSAQFDHGATGLSGAERTPIPDDGLRMDIDKPSFRPDAPASWGFTPAGRRIDGLAVHEGRLYYAVAQGPEIWSVGLLADGGFASDARFETAVPGQGAPVVTKIVFDASGRMTLALRGAARSPFDYGRFVDADSGDVLRFTPAQPDGAGPSPLWSARPDSYAIGASPGGRAASGGVSLGHAYRADGRLDMEICDAMLLATGDALGAGRGNAAAQGLQMNDAERVRPGNGPPAQSMFLDFDSRHGNPLQLGHVGDVAAFQRCAGQVGAFLADNTAPPVVESPPPVAVSAMPPVAQGATGNVAVAKAQNCRLVSPQTAECAYMVTTLDTGTMPFQGHGGVIQDTFSVVPDTLSLPEGASPTRTGFQLPFTPIPAGGGPQPGLSFKASFSVPAGGLVVENCAMLTFPGPGAGGSGARNAGGHRVSVTSGPICRPNNDGSQSCAWDVVFENRSGHEAGASFTFTTQPENQGVTGPSSAGLTDIDGRTTLVKGPDIGPGEARTARLVATFPPNMGGPSATVALIEGLAADGQVASAAMGADADPADNTACVRWDSSNPSDQGTPASAPTKLPPIVTDAEPRPGSRDSPSQAIPDPNASNLTLTKTQSCQMQGANQARCSYQVAVTNSGQTPFQFGAGAVIDDTFDVQPTTLTVPQGGQKTATGFSIISAGRVVIGPGAPATFAFDATFAVPPGGLRATNCAAMTLPAGGTPIPAMLTPIDDAADGAVLAPAKGLDKSVSIVGRPVCISRGAVKDCAWTVQVANTGSVPFPFGFKFATNPANSAISAVNLTPSREGAATVLEGGSILMPGMSRTMTVQATVPAGTAPVTATVTASDAVSQANSGTDVNPANDTATAQAGGQPSQANPPGETSTDSDPADNLACVTFDSKAPAEPKIPAPVSLKIDKLALTPQCEKSAQAQNWNCAFEVTVTNIGDAPFSGPIVIADETNFAVIAQPSAGVTCDNNGTLDHRCEIAAVTLAPNASTTFTLNSTLPFVAVPVGTPPGRCRLDNTVTIASPPTGGAAATATAQLPAVANQGKAVPCDPPSLQLAKTAQGCIPSAIGFACKYRLTVTSTGPDPFQDAPIDIAERLPEGAEVMAVSSGWACSGSGSATHCHHGNVTLSVGAALHLDLTVAVPESAVARGQCEIDNEAEIVQPGRDMTHAGTRLRASASAAIQSPQCQPPAPTPMACYGGMVLAEPGRCECPPGQEYDTIRRSCVSPPPPVCPAGWSGQYPICCQPGTSYEDGVCLPHTAPPPPPDCPRGWQGDYPTCCPPGQDYLEGRCEIPRQLPVVEPKRCGGERPVGDWPDCCPRGTYYEDGNCRRREVEPDLQFCGGDRPIGERPNCCPVGTSYRRGECHPTVIVPEIRECGGDRPIGIWPNCCPQGTYFDRGICRPVVVDVPVVCRPDQVVDRQAGRCVDVACTGRRPVGTPPNCCPRGTQYRDGACRRPEAAPPPCPPNRPVGTPPYCCPRGQQYLNGTCRRAGADICRAGQERRRGRCVDIGCPAARPVGTPPYCCPRGTSYIRGTCRAGDPGSAG